MNIIQFSLNIPSPSIHPDFPSLFVLILLKNIYVLIIFMKNVIYKNIIYHITFDLLKKLKLCNMLKIFTNNSIYNNFKPMIEKI